MTEEQKRKISEANKGRLIGDKNPFYGKRHNEETLRKISESGRGRTSPMKGKKTNKPSWNRGLLATPEARRRMSESQKRVQSNPEVRKRMVATRKARGLYKHSEEQKRKFKETISNPEVKKKMSETIKRSWTPELRKKQSIKLKGKTAWNKGIPPSKETIEKQKETYRKSLLANPEIREKIRKAIVKRYEKGEEPWNKGTKGVVKAWNKGKKMPELSEWGRQNILKQYESGVFPRQTDTKPERQIKEELIKRGYKEGIDFIHQYKFMNKFFCDFCFPKQKVIVEADGDYWHTKPNSKYSENEQDQAQKNTARVDKSKNAYIQKVDNGSWTLLRFWESDINKNVVDCVDKIEEAVRKV